MSKSRIIKLRKFLDEKKRERIFLFLGNYDTDDKLWDQKPKNHGLNGK